MEILGRFALRIGAALALTACAVSSPLVIAGNAVSGVRLSAGSQTFKYTGAEQWFTVPAGVSSVTIVARGAQGGAARYYSAPGGGRGGRVYAQIPVTSGEKLAVFVGGEGSDAAGGFNGGGNPGTFERTEIYGGGGGGASDVREGGDTLQDRVIVAGGGGGLGCCFFGGDAGAGGGLIGERGASGQSDGVASNLGMAARAAIPCMAVVVERAEEVITISARVGKALMVRSLTAAKAALGTADPQVGAAVEGTLAAAAAEVVADTVARQDLFNPAAVVVAGAHHMSSRARVAQRCGKAGRKRRVTALSFLVGNDR